MLRGQLELLARQQLAGGQADHGGVVSFRLPGFARFLTPALRSGEERATRRDLPRPSSPLRGAREDISLYRASTREREGPTAKPWEGEGRAGEHSAVGETPLYLEVGDAERW